MFSEVAKIAQVMQQQGQFQQPLKTVILLLNFTRIHCDYLLITKKAKLLNFGMLKTDNRWLRTSFSYSSKFACKFPSFAHFLKTFFHHSVLFFMFSFSLLAFNSSIYSLSTILKRDTIQKNNFSIE
mgnify:CR=1 FL=1